MDKAKIFPRRSVQAPKKFESPTKNILDHCSIVVKSTTLDRAIFCDSSINTNPEPSGRKSKRIDPDKWDCPTLSNIPQDWSISCFRLTPGHGCLKALFDLVVEGIPFISDLRLIQQPNQRPWIQAPMYEVPRWQPLMRMSLEVKREIEAKVLPFYIKLSGSQEDE